MALISCKSCGNQISPQAASCPKCGAPLPKPVSLVKLTGAAIICVIVFPIFYSCTTALDRTTEPAPVKSAEQIAAEKAKEKTFQRVVGVVKAANNQLRDPESARWEAILANDDVSLVCMEVRAKNGFGGYSKEQLIYDGTSLYRGGKHWNRLCGGKTLTNFILAAKAIDAL